MSKHNTIIQDLVSPETYTVTTIKEHLLKMVDDLEALGGKDWQINILTNDESITIIIDIEVHDG